MQATLRFEVDAGIALITLEDPGKPMNVVSPQFIDDLITAIERVATDPAIRGAIITSAKPAFMAGADLKYIASIAGGALSVEQAVAFSQKPSKQMHRRLETCGKPFIAAINGLALGGGFELCLACHSRVIVDDKHGRHRANAHYTVRVAIAGGIADARSAGPSTAIWPSSQRITAPIGKNSAGSRATLYLLISIRFIA